VSDRLAVLAEQKGGAIRHGAADWKQRTAGPDAFVDVPFEIQRHFSRAEMDSETGMRCAGALEQVEVAPVDAVAAEHHKPQIVEPLVVSEGFHHMAKQGGDCTEDRDATAAERLREGGRPEVLGRQDMERRADQQRAQRDAETACHRG
jgi:hypothetical protein